MKHLVYAATGLPAGGDGDVARDWQGWRFVPEVELGPPGGGRGRRRSSRTVWALCSPSGGRGWRPAELDFMGMQVSRVRELERELERLRGPAQFLLPLA